MQRETRSTVHPCHWNQGIKSDNKTSLSSVALKWYICVHVQGNELDHSSFWAVLHEGGDNRLSFVYLLRFKPTTAFIFIVVMYVYVQKWNVIWLTELVFYVPWCVKHFVMIIAFLFALFLSFPCLKINLTPNTVFFKMSTELCSQLFCGCLCKGFWKRVAKNINVAKQ